MHGSANLENMKIYIANQSKQKLGGGFVFLENFRKGARGLIDFVNTWQESNVVFIASATMTPRDEIVAAKEAKKGKQRIDMMGKIYFGANEDTIRNGIEKMRNKKIGMKIPNYPKNRKSQPCSLEKTKKISEAQLKNEKPSHKVMQSLSLFMGTPLDSTLSPQNIMAAQAVFAQQRASIAAAPAQTKMKGLEKASKSYMTQDQAAAERRLKA